MISVLHHRGPDGFGYYTEGPLGLAHARLSIIDLATGDQPISNEDGSVWTIFNGEIFNYIELRATLEQLGHRFRTRSDTETIVHAYEQYGDDFLTHLNGQFAIALWDVNRKRLLLARDRAGVRPLFHARNHGRLLFGSEVKAILAVAPELASLDTRALAQVFTFWSTVGERTVFNGVRSVQPGHVLVIENGVERLQRYWNWSFPARGHTARLTLDEAAEQCRALLIDSVRLQLRSDVPVGAYLSGGLDSSGIVSCVRNHTTTPMRTFSVAFEDEEFDESAHQQDMARYLGTEHTSVRCSSKNIGEIFPELIRHTESPVLRSAPAPLMMLSRVVRQAGLKVVLTGEGADEIFGGYDLFKEARIRRFWATQPDSRWRSVLFERLYPYLKHSPVANQAFARSFFGQDLRNTSNPFYGHVTRWSTTRGLWKFLSADVKASLNDWAVEDELRAMLPPEFSSWDDLSRDQYIEVQTLLYGYLLSSQGDRVAMASSVEGRVPFLDHRLIEFANQLSPRCKLRGLTEKAVLRRALAGMLPASIVKRVKQPYRAPDSQSFFAEGRPLEYVAELLSPGPLRSAGYFEPATVQALVEKCRAGRAAGAGDNMALVGVLSTMLLHHHFLNTSSA
jgi:asparagine synthase (glutamine-hydrolysing)